MAKNLAPQDLNTPADNLLPFPAILASSATGEKLYTADELKQTFTPGAATNRTVRNLVAKVREAYHWLDEVEFKRGDKFTQFAFDQIKAMKDSGLTQKQWIVEIQKRSPQLLEQQPEVINQSALVFIESANPFNGLSIPTKATQKRELLQAELIETEFETDANFEAFLTLSTELVEQDEAALDADELEFQLLRKRNAAKWLKRKAILEADKQQILQGEVRPKSPVGNG